MPGQQHGGGPIELQQGQVVVARLLIVVLVNVDPLDSSHLLRGAAAAQEELPQVGGPQRGRVQTASEQIKIACHGKWVFYRLIAGIF